MRRPADRPFCNPEHLILPLLAASTLFQSKQKSAHSYADEWLTPQGRTKLCVQGCANTELMSRNLKHVFSPARSIEPLMSIRVVRCRVRFERDSLMRNWFYMLILKRRGRGEERRGGKLNGKWGICMEMRAEGDGVEIWVVGRVRSSQPALSALFG